jgi:hypothetical protein
MVDLLLNVGLLSTIACVVLFFWKKEPRYGYAAAVLLALVPALQLLLFLLSPKIDPSVDKLRALAVPLQILFAGLCAVCAALMYRLARQLHDRQ